MLISYNFQNTKSRIQFQLIEKILPQYNENNTEFVKMMG